MKHQVNPYRDYSRIYLKKKDYYGIPRYNEWTTEHPEIVNHDCLDS